MIVTLEFKICFKYFLCINVFILAVYEGYGDGITGGEQRVQLKCLAKSFYFPVDKKTNNMNLLSFFHI